MANPELSKREGGDPAAGSNSESPESRMAEVAQKFEEYNHERFGGKEAYEQWKTEEERIKEKQRQERDPLFIERDKVYLAISRSKEADFSGDFYKRGEAVQEINNLPRLTTLENKLREILKNKKLTNLDGARCPDDDLAATKAHWETIVMGDFAMCGKLPAEFDAEPDIKAALLTKRQAAIAEAIKKVTDMFDGGAGAVERLAVTDEEERARLLKELENM